MSIKIQGSVFEWPKSTMHDHNLEFNFYKAFKSDMNNK